MSTTVTIEEGTFLFPLPQRFDLERGGSILGGQLAYELVGAEDGPLVVIQGGISAGRHVTACLEVPGAGWWDALVGPGRAVDTDRCRVLGVDYLGGGGASTGPASSSQRPFPRVTPADQAEALKLLVDHVAEGAPVIFIGASYGGMVGLAFAARFPERLRQLVAISAPDRSHPRATAWRCLQRRIVALGRDHGDAHEGMRLARALAMTTYRSADEFGARFDLPPRVVDGQPSFPVEDYVLARGRHFANTFDVDAFLCLSEALDLHRVDPGAITTATTLVAADSDPLVPVEQIRDLGRRIAGPVRLVEIESLHGHDAFLTEPDLVGGILREALRVGEPAEVRS